MQLHDLLAHHRSGHYRYREAWETSRRNPDDYVLIWVLAGDMEILVGDTAELAHPGDLVILEPGIPHRYSAATVLGWQWLWLHYGGLVAADLTRRLRGPADQPVRPLGSSAHLVTRFTELITSAATAAAMPSGGHELKLDSCTYSLIGLIISQLESSPDSIDGDGTDLSHLTTWILDHLDSAISLGDLVRESGWSVAQLSRLTRREFGMPPMQYATRLRMQRAERLLLETSLAVSEIAALVGFDDPLHFSRRFRQISGVSPSTFRRSQELGPPDTVLAPR